MFARNRGEAPRRERRQLVSRILFEWGTGYSGFGLFGPRTTVLRSRSIAERGSRTSKVYCVPAGAVCGIENTPEGMLTYSVESVDHYLCHRREAA